LLVYEISIAAIALDSFLILSILSAAWQRKHLIDRLEW